MAAPPALADADLAQVAARTESTMPLPLLTVRTETAMYEDPAVQAALAPLLREGTEQTPYTVFTSRLSFQPRIPGGAMPGAVVDVAARHASDEFAASLADDGLVDVEQIAERRLAIRDGSARVFEYEAGFPLDGEAVYGDDAAVGRPLLQVGIVAALWPRDGSFEMAGGIFPREDLAAMAAREGATLATDQSLAVDPEADRERIHGYIRMAAAGGDE